MDQDIVVCEPLRTPIGAFGGQFRDIPAHELSATVVRELMSRTGLDPELVADVIMGQGYATSEAPRSEERRVGKECRSRWWQRRYERRTRYISHEADTITQKRISSSAH